MNDFATFLLTLKHWDHYVVDQFISGEYQNRLKGRHTKEFVKQIDLVIAKLKELLDEVDITEFCVCLKSFQKMSKVLSLVLIDEYENVKTLLPTNTTITSSSTMSEIAQAIFEVYDNECAMLFENGFESFMHRVSTTNEHMGETFYLHNLKHYMPKIMRTTYARHQLGPAIFTMEGFEYKNYTSKQVMRSRTNGRGVQCMQSLRVMQLLYITSLFCVQHELKKQERDNDA